MTVIGSRRLLATLLLACVPASTAAQDAPSLVKDMTSVISVRSSDPASFTDVGGRTCFAAAWHPIGLEPWCSDGTAAGTALLLDADPGVAGSDAWPTGSVGTAAAFSMDVESVGTEPWITDGTAGGTRLLADINPGAAHSHAWGFTNFAGATYFSAAHEAYGQELWRTDGTAAGTTLVKDILPGEESSWVDWLTVVGGRLVFSADDGVNGYELWTTDGTGAGTGLLADISPGPEGSIQDIPFAAGGFVWFNAATPSAGAELWRTDGTAAGTTLVADIAPGADHSNPYEFAELGGNVYFSAWHPATGRELWRSDGTAAGTVLVKDIDPRPATFPEGSSSPEELAVVGSQLLFAADDGTNGRELWRTDGTGAGTFLVADVSPGPASSGPGDLVALGTTLLFAAREPGTGKELWRSDGTPAGTTLVVDLEPGTQGSNPRQLHVGAGRMFFSAETTTTGREVHVSDGSAAGTSLLRNTQPELPDTRVIDVADGGAKLWISTTEPEGSLGAWASDGTDAGTRLVAAPVSPLHVLGDVALFLTPAPSGLRPAAIDAAATGTVILHPSVEVRSNDFGLGPPFVMAGGFAWFRGWHSGTGVELWRTDGTPAGTSLVADVAPGAQGSSARPLGGDASILYFAADATGTTGLELWRTDGTAGGTMLVEDTVPGGYGGLSDPWLPWTVFGSKLFFVAADPAIGPEPWISDGTAAGTMLLRDIAPGPEGSIPHVFYQYAGSAPVALPDRVLFVAGDPISGLELWQTDGTAAGTTLVIDMLPGLGSSFPHHLSSMGGTCWFAATHPSSGTELWRTDGTPAGTVLVRDVHAGAEGSGVSWITPLPDGTGAYFAATDGATGTELWWSDGTAAGTRLVTDLLPGPEGSAPSHLTVSGGRLDFFADDGSGIGRELWAVPLGSGQLPDGARIPGVPLTVRKAAPGEIALSWSPSCVAGDDDFIVYEGEIGSFGSHAPVACSTAGATSHQLVPANPRSYFLVAPRTTEREGGIGWRSDGTPRPRTGGTCAPVRIGGCG